MAGRDTNPPDPGTQAPFGPRTASGPTDRLESWKEIAAYLKRGLRTVQRWEKEVSLPIHRLQHDKGSSIYAYKSELDAWWHNGHSRLETETETEEEGAAAPRPASSAVSGESPDGHSQPERADVLSHALAPTGIGRRWLWLAAATVAVASAVIAVYLSRPSQPPPLNFQPHATILIATFDNRTGDSVLDGTLEYALERELTNSQFVSVAPRVRINDTLALMRRPANTRIDAALGREICLRDGGIRAMITGRIDKVGSTYVLGAQLVDPADGRTVASFEEEASSQAAILPAIHKLSDSIREALGEDSSQIRQADIALRKVTTPSLKALQLYSLADQEMEGGNDPAAFELLRQAIAEDPKFASAYAMAAWALSNQDKPRSEFMPYAKRALELSAGADEAERSFIEGSYYWWANEPDKAIAAYEALLESDPGNYWGANNLAQLYAGQGEEQQAVDTFTLAAKLRPDSFVAQANATYFSSTVADNAAEARPFLRRATALLGEMSANARPGDSDEAVWVQLYPAYQAWMKDDVALAERDLIQAEKHPVEQDTLSLPRDFGFFSLTLGQTRKAEAWFRRVSPGLPLLYDSDFPVVDFVRGDRTALRSSLQRIARLPEQGAVPVSLMIQEGMLRDAGDSAAIRWYNKHRPYVELLNGQFLVARGRTAEGMRLLRNGVERDRSWAEPVYFLGAEALAQAYERQGNSAAALQVLEEASSNRARVNYFIAMAGAPLWMQDQMELAKFYRRLGRVQDAQKIEDELRKLLTYADPDFPLLVELNKLQKAPAVAKLN